MANKNPIFIKHKNDPNARISLGEPDADGLVEIDVSQLEMARAHGWDVAIRAAPAGGDAAAGTETAAKKPTIA